MKFTTKKPLFEEVVIKPYSVQAIARKRNMLMNTLQLNDVEFMNWVRDRMYRVAEQNGVPVKELSMDLISAGFKEWETTLRQGDKDFDKYAQQFMEYSEKFMRFATQITRQATTDPNPGKLTPDENVVPPSSPKMVKFQASDNVK